MDSEGTLYLWILDTEFIYGDSHSLYSIPLFVPAELCIKNLTSYKYLAR